MRTNGKSRSFIATLLLAAWALTLPAAGTTIDAIAGTGNPGDSGEGGSATAADINLPYGVDIDSDGNLYFTDEGNDKVKKVDVATGFISTIAGTGVRGDSGEGGPATAAKLDSPCGLALDDAGNVYFADRGNHKVKRIDAVTGIITTIAGTGMPGSSGDGGPAAAAKLRMPSDVAIDEDDNILIADRANHKIRRIDGVTGIITTFAGTGQAGDSGDGGLATAAKLFAPAGVALDADGNVFVCDETQDRVRRIDAVTGIIDAFAGTGTAGDLGDGGAATAAQLNQPSGVTVDSVGDVYIADTLNNKIRRVDAVTGIITTFAGTGQAGDGGDGGPATAALLTQPSSVIATVDPDTGLKCVTLVDRNNHRLRRVVLPRVTVVRWQEIDPTD